MCGHYSATDSVTIAVWAAQPLWKQKDSSSSMTCYTGSLDLFKSQGFTAKVVVNKEGADSKCKHGGLARHGLPARSLLLLSGWETLPQNQALLNPKLCNLSGQLQILEDY